MRRSFHLILFLSLTFLCLHTTFATHLKAGEITSQRISGFQYRFILTIFLDSNSVASTGGPDSPLNEKQAELKFSDGTSKFENLSQQTSIGNATYKNVYYFLHTFSGSGTYTVSYQKDNRNANILNIRGGNSEVQFYIESTVRISPFLGVNNSPSLLYPPIDIGYVGQIYKHNPGAYDPEGDSLSYELGVPKQFQGINVPDYVSPNQINNTTSGTFTLDPITGDLIWNRPVKEGLYNIAIIIKEWRNGQIIGSIVRDMQITIKKANNKPPEVIIPKDTCALAGTKLSIEIKVTDPDLDKVIMSATGGPFITNPSATFSPTTPQATTPFPAIGSFNWNLTCALVREQPYQVLFKAEDLHPGGTQLFDLESWSVKVIGAAPDGLTANPTTGGFQLTWNSYACSQASRMEIYRKDCDSSAFVPDPCGGIPANSTFKKIGEVPISTNFFLDTAIVPGSFYCYVIVALFSDPKGGVSLASEQTCILANEGEPLPLTASVIKTDKVNGQVQLRWTQPLELDMSRFPGPYRYIVSRANGINGTDFLPIGELSDLSDTTLIDSLINTVDTGHNYRLAFYYSKNNNYTLKSISSTFSTVFVSAKPANESVPLTWVYDVPWVNEDHFHRIYRVFPDSMLLDSVVVTGESGNFLVNGLTNGDSVCFFVETAGEYCRSGLPNPLLNKSQVVCVVPRDTLPPCPPFLNGPVTCIEDGVHSLTLTWKPDFSDGCNKEIKSYNVYYAEHEGDELKLLVSNVPDTFFVDVDNFSLAGCYAVSALNFYGQESAKSNKICVDICVYYELPNLVTPNRDNKNDFFRPYPIPKNVQQVNFSVYNRWGDRVYFSNNNVNLDWSGVDEKGNDVASGIYFFEAEVIFKRRLRKQDEVKIIKGWVHVIRKENGEIRE